MRVTVNFQLKKSKSREGGKCPVYVSCTLNGERYADPLIMQNEKKLEGLKNSYGPDIFSKFVSHRNRFSQTIDYKQYRDNKFFELENDPLELHPLDSLSQKENRVYPMLKEILEKAEKESPWVKERK